MPDAAVHVGVYVCLCVHAHARACVSARTHHNVGTSRASGHLEYSVDSNGRNLEHGEEQPQLERTYHAGTEAKAALIAL